VKLFSIYSNLYIYDQCDHDTERHERTIYCGINRALHSFARKND